MGLNPFLVSVCALEGAVHNRALLDTPVAIFPAHGDVEHHIERPKGLEALRLAPDIDQPGYRDQLINQVELLKAGFHVVEGDKLKAIPTRLLRFWFAAWLCRLEVNHRWVGLSSGQAGLRIDDVACRPANQGDKGAEALMHAGILGARRYRYDTIPGRTIKRRVVVKDTSGRSGRHRI